MQAGWHLAADRSGTVVPESWWFRPRDLRHARQGVLHRGDPPLVEVWCDPPTDVARARYVARRRDAAYEDGARLARYWDD